MKPSLSDELDYYAILDVAPDASPAEIKQAYRILVKRYHPDLYALNSDVAWEAEMIMRELNRAYEVLSDSQKRQQHDEKRRKQMAGPAIKTSAKFLTRNASKVATSLALAVAFSISLAVLSNGWIHEVALIFTLMIGVVALLVSLLISVSQPIRLNQ